MKPLARYFHLGLIFSEGDCIRTVLQVRDFVNPLASGLDHHGQR